MTPGDPSTMPSDEPMSGDQAAALLADRAASLVGSDRPPVIGLNGAQGSGKSTMAKAMGEALALRHGLSQVIVSLDDFYLSRALRQELARSVHPLCATRGVPGTHDVALMRRTLDSLLEAGPASETALPRFDKLADDRLAPGSWTAFEGKPDVILLEGWCVGVRRSDLERWSGPINALEHECDPDGAWFAWSRAALERYEKIWDRFALLFSIEVPDLETVIESRLRQERGLTSSSGSKPMDRAGVERFVQHYERYTRAIWAAMPARADMLLQRDRAFAFTLAAQGDRARRRPR